jgi:hypothetical protein
MEARKISRSRRSKENDGGKENITKQEVTRERWRQGKYHEAGGHKRTMEARKISRSTI